MSEPQPKRPEGRPPIFDGVADDLIIAKLEQAFAYDCTVLEACSYANISKDTFYRYIKEHPEFSDRIEQLREMPVLQARQSVVSALASNPELALKYLERKKRKEFATRTEAEQKTVTEFDDMSDEDLEKIINATDPNTPR
jgi:hypothetical protein